jgi:O-antigen/teichoic acid export membrane protein
MTDKLTKNIFSAAGQTVVQTIVMMILYRYLLDTIGVEKFGIWAVVLATASAARVSELGMAGSVTKFVASFFAQDNDLAIAEIIQTAAISLGLAFGLILIISYPILFWLLPYVLPEQGLELGRIILPYGLISLWMTSLASIWMSGLDGVLRSDIRAGIMIFGSFAFLIISLFSVRHYGLLGLAIAQVVQGIILVLLGWLGLKRTILSLPLFPLQWKMARFKEMFCYGVNFQVNSIVKLLFEPITKILLGHFGDLSAAGYFEMAQRVVMKVRALIVESNRVIVPVFAGLDASNGDVGKLYVNNIRFLLFLITPVFASLLAFSSVISEIWIGSLQTQFVAMLTSLTLAWYLNSITTPAYFVYLGQGKLRWVTFAHIFIGVTNLIFGYIFGNFWGWQGVILGFTCALVFGSLIPVWAYHHENNLNILNILTTNDVILIFMCFGSAAIMLWGSYFIHDSILSIWVRFILVMIVIGVVTLTAIWLHPLSKKIFTNIKDKLKKKSLNQIK